jgi:hypothetical protein
MTEQEAWEVLLGLPQKDQIHQFYQRYIDKIQRLNDESRLVEVETGILGHGEYIRFQFIAPRFP